MMDIGLTRLANQRLLDRPFPHPADVVAWLGALQAQEYLGTLWAIGLRMTAATEATVAQALAERTIVQTWPMRGTLHFVAAADTAHRYGEFLGLPAIVT
ncbi:MAG: winged helix DNA-binding domain-containing protein [Caldilineaceae bacterium]|nr:winged helix DNA-binding domain-containing protein [Caldilineaceae bacterium]